MSTKTKNRKIAVLGSRAVGKSSLTVQFVENKTIENTFTRQLKYKGVDYICDIVDTAGQDEYSIFNSKHAIGIHGYILVYSIASIQSFEMIQTIREKILNYAGMDWVPIVIVGNKSDLFTQRQVTVEQVKQLSLDWKCCFIETSAKLNQNIQKVFEMMICEIEKPNETNESCVLL